ncbi:MAG: MFS transporter [Dehalococcoidia bacterium]
MTGSGRRSLLLLCAAGFAYALVETASYLMLPIYFVEELRFDPSIAGGLLAVVGLASLAARFPSGKAYGVGMALRLAFAGAGAGALSMAILGASQSVPGILVALIGIGLALSSASTLQLATLSALHRDGALGSALGWYTAAIGIGHTVGGVLVGYLADVFGVTSVLAFIAAACVAGTGLWVVAQRRTGYAPRTPRSTDDDQEPSETSATSVSPRRGPWARMFRVKTIWSGTLVAAFVLVVVINTYNSSVSSFHPVMAVAAGLSFRQVGVLSSARSVASSLVRLGAGLWLRRTNGERLIWPLVVLGAVAIGLLPTLRASMWAQILLFLAMGASRGLLRITGSSVAMSGYDSAHARGQASATLNAGLDIGKLLGPLVGGGLVAVAGLGTMFPLVALAGVAAYWVASRRVNES